MQAKKNKRVKLKKSYSRGKDLLLFALGALLFGILFYRFVYTPVFQEKSLQVSKNVYLVYRITERKSSGDVIYGLHLWNQSNKIFGEIETENSKSKFLLSGQDYLIENGKQVRLLERGLNPLNYPYTPALYTFISRNSKEYLNFKQNTNLTFLGRDAAHVSFDDSFKKGRKYEFIFDASTGFPLTVKISEDGEVIFKSEAAAISENELLKNQLFELKKDKAIDVFENLRVSPSEVQSILFVNVYPPTWIPPELENSRILKLSNYRPPFSTVSINRDCLLFVYYDSDKFVQICEFRGSFPYKPLNTIMKFKAKNREFILTTAPGYYLAWGKDGNNTLVIASNLDKELIIKVAEGLFE